MGLVQAQVGAAARARTPEEWARCLADPWWRLCSGDLYNILIKGDDGQESDSQIAPFLPNINQLRFFRSVVS